MGVLFPLIFSLTSSHTGRRPSDTTPTERELAAEVYNSLKRHQELHGFLCFSQKLTSSIPDARLLELYDNALRKIILGCTVSTGRPLCRIQCWRQDSGNGSRHPTKRHLTTSAEHLS
ncbi:uncharacterized protein BO80DRAFT_64456 [Aspergillus ibericus CBS 121593]|uniref:Uncharacterized protein n=1 Tax=Aspergillus ibericus CBS 121593 TaxID=1448316 RepID=A0A395H0D5_9EURO|nr:hypothetical protein BO80DRAFT_64456 [Aspergillus ibericus CBS 121593]RAL01292.1 hypothetical protein BO80DRAFT_64456 [Aspergillus ibericus CBS 121593]